VVTAFDEEFPEDVAADPGEGAPPAVVTAFDEEFPEDVAPGPDVGTPEPVVFEGDVAAAAGDGGDGTDVALEAETGTLHVAIPGYYQLSLFGMGDVLLGPPAGTNPRPFGRTLGQNFYGWGRLRVSPELEIESVRIKAQFDVMTGMLFGDSAVGVSAALEPRMREDPDGGGEDLMGIRPFDFRQLFVEWDTGYGILRAGQQASSWGMGLLANDGDHDQRFGYNRYGDLVERIVFATKPLNTVTDSFLRDVILILGADLVYRDHLADIWDGDLAWQGIFALLYREEANSAGAYVAYRNQTFDDGDTLEVVAVDVTADWTVPLATDLTLRLAGEGVGVFGSTTAARALAASSHDIMQFGGAVRAGVDWRGFLLADLELGAATGDADTTDDRLLRFTFDPDHNVGLLLFEEVLAWQTARAATMGGSPDLVGAPPPGLDLLPTNGGVSGAVYLNPTVRIVPFDWFDATVGVLWAYAASDVVSPFEQKVRGGPVNYLGGDASRRNLGTEIDLAVDFHVPLRLVQLNAGAQFGYLFLGEAFADENGDRGSDVWLVEGRVSMVF
jgi:hypothetical protein